ncbi:MAG TPA: phosphotransferase, partial [Polyangiaceae bacterium]
MRGRRIELGEALGSGATSTVFRAETPSGPVALKLGRGPAQRLRFADECARLAWVSSPELLTVLDAGVMREGRVLPDGSRLEAGSPFLLLEWFDGAVLDPLRPQTPEAGRELALVVARDIGRALADLHAAGSAHGDVKPSNIVVAWDASGRPRRARLVDFGLAGEATEVVPRGGTRRYLAPEVQEAGGDARLRDLYALGAVLAELVVPELARAERLSPELLVEL